KDTVFWFVAPEVSKHIPVILDSPIVFRINTYNQAASISITQPAGGGVPPININVPANSSHTVGLSNWMNSIENRPPNTILNKGFLIESDNPISIYYEIVTGAGSTAPRQDNPESFILKGKNALGLSFIIPSQNLLINDVSRFDPDPFSAFDIVATENNTSITITP